MKTPGSYDNLWCLLTDERRRARSRRTEHRQTPRTFSPARAAYLSSRTGANRRGYPPRRRPRGHERRGRARASRRSDRRGCFARSRTGGGGRQSGTLIGAPPGWRGA
ncbi:hypothetical protein Taro_043564 [Colocasia esculenta]|uniref:Uncharacterized protein n=1 Tax=Colocasia esculenta TaxID=4460 RepID=A0A843WSE6_COLES|nr:hypothetical protein [Colocasia esculenta]